MNGEANRLVGASTIQSKDTYHTNLIYSFVRLLHGLWLRRAIVFIERLVMAGLLGLLTSQKTLAGLLYAPATQGPDGKSIYEQRCAACHGLAGDGAGPAAKVLFTKPRDFTRDEFKIKSTEGDEFPTREDVMRVIAEGMPGSAMPAWSGVLSQAEIGAVADYVKSFGAFFSKEGYGQTAIRVPARIDPSAESIARGQALYASDIQCIKCHGPAGRGDGPSALTLKDTSGNVIYPADLTQPWRFRGGSKPEDIYLRLRTGTAGSPMPSFAEALPEEDTWHLVNYILSLSTENAPEPAVLLTSHYIDGSIPDNLDDPAWKAIAPADYPLAGQIMRVPRYYQPSINSVMVKALYNASAVAFYVTWDDRTETRSGEAVDAMAIQFPTDLPTSPERPYFVFGDPDHTVYQLYWAANSDKVIERNANGLNAVKEQPADQSQATGTAHYQDGQWQLLIRRPLNTGGANDLTFVTDRFIPIAFMVWDGYASEAGSRLGLTTWSRVYLQSPTPTTIYLWIPIAMVVVVVLELLVVWWARRVPH